MKLTIKSTDPVSSDDIKEIIDDLNEKYKSYGICIKNMTLYIRFINEDGKLVEPVDNYGDPIDLVYNLNKKIKVRVEDDILKIIDNIVKNNNGKCRGKVSELIRIGDIKKHQVIYQDTLIINKMN